MADFLEAPALCLDCGATPNQAPAAFCQTCGGRRIVRHPELASLSIAHVDCDAFYASIEKRDDPSLADRPVIVGGGERGVVTTACYVARTFGVRSAMPMFQALKACPGAVVIRPDFPKYAAVAREIRSMMEKLTPLVEPVSIDEAFLDLSGTRRVLRKIPAAALAELQRGIKRKVGITVSIGLGANKFLAKIASDFDKPNGFSIIGAREAKAILAPMPVAAIWGVGAVFARRLNADGLVTIGDLQRTDPSLLAKRYGENGLRLAALAQGEDRRRVSPSGKSKSVSAETTFHVDISDPMELEDRLWPLCERVASRMKAKHCAGKVVTLKLKTADFHTITRRTTLPQASNLARTAFDVARAMLAECRGRRAYRLIGVGYSVLCRDARAPQADFFGDVEDKARREEDAIEAIRNKFGADAISSGRFHAKRIKRNRIAALQGDKDD